MSKVGESLSAICAIGVANSIYNKGRWWKQNIYTGKLGAAKHIITGGSYPLSAILRTGPELLGAAGFELGVKAAHYIPAYIEAWKE